MGGSLQQNRPARIDIEWPTIRNKPIEIGESKQRNDKDAESARAGHVPARA
jgi:hypothetical protein